MTIPAKVIGFLDIFGDWDPSLMFVMMGAIFVHGISYRLIANRTSPFLDTEFHIPTNQRIDGKLILGAALFGIGWGLVGLCPGPAITSLFTLDSPLLLFVGSMFSGIAFFHYIVKPLLRRMGI